jgi:hypothetical protein
MFLNGLIGEGFIRLLPCGFITENLVLYNCNIRAYPTITLCGKIPSGDE